MPVARYKGSTVCFKVGQAIRPWRHSEKKFGSTGYLCADGPSDALAPQCKSHVHLYRRFACCLVHLISPSDQPPIGCYPLLGWQCIMSFRCIQNGLQLRQGFVRGGNIGESLNNISCRAVGSQRWTQVGEQQRLLPELSEKPFDFLSCCSWRYREQFVRQLLIGNGFTSHGECFFHHLSSSHR